MQWIIKQNSNFISQVYTMISNIKKARKFCSYISEVLQVEICLSHQSQHVMFQWLFKCMKEALPWFKQCQYRKDKLTKCQIIKKFLQSPCKSYNCKSDGKNQAWKQLEDQQTKRKHQLLRKDTSYMQDESIKYKRLNHGKNKLWWASCGEVFFGGGGNISLVVVVGV